MKKKAKNRPLTYRVQNACCNCRHAFHFSEYDEETDHFCTLGAPKRPPCGSICMDEGFGWKVNDKDRKAEKASERWDKWAEGRQVSAHGVCDKYEATKEWGGST